MEADQAIRQEVHQEARNPNNSLGERILLHLGAMSLEESGASMDMAYQTMRFGCYVQDAVTDVAEGNPVHGVTKEKLEDAALWTAALTSQLAGKGLGKKVAGPGVKNVRDAHVSTSAHTKSTPVMGAGQSHQTTHGVFTANQNRTRLTANSNQLKMQKTGTGDGAGYFTTTLSSQEKTQTLYNQASGGSGRTTTTTTTRSLPAPPTGNLPQIGRDGTNGRKINCTKAESPIWKSLKPYKGGMRTNGQSGKKTRYYEWDHTHNDIEVYDGKMKHLGSMDPKTGEMYKQAVKGREKG